MNKKLFNPFIQIAGMKALGIGLIFVLASTLLAWIFNTHFDGVLDVHFAGPSTLYRHIIYGLINIFSLTAVFYLIAILLTQGKTRLSDIAGTMTLARFPFAVLPFLNIGEINTRIGEKIIYGIQAEMGQDILNSSHFSCNPCTVSTLEYVYLIFSMIVIFTVIAWYITLLFNAYKISTNLKGVKVILSFVAGLILAEITSAILIHFIL